MSDFYGFVFGALCKEVLGLFLNNYILFARARSKYTMEGVEGTGNS